MKDIKDYLHLYLGATCEITWTEECCEEMGFEDGLHRIDGVVLDNLEGIESGKIHVRPLSDMKEEEAKDLELSDVQIGLMYCDKPIPMFMTPSQFKEIISKRFDLFGLIEAGLAIDKTKL